MTSEAADTSEAELLALRSACVVARAAVAADPASEEAAETLFNVVSRATRALSGNSSLERRTVAPVVAEAGQLLEQGAAEEAEVLLRRHLSATRNDPDAMLLMATIAVRCGFPQDAEKILRRSVEVHPSRAYNWIALARLLLGQATGSDQATGPEGSLVALGCALAADPKNLEALELRAAVLLQMRRLDDAERALLRLLEIYPENSTGWLNYAYLLKTLGRFGEAVAAYRTALTVDPANGAIWWSFADMKLARFFPADIRRMEAVAAEQSMDELARVDIHFALAVAYDQAGDYARAAEYLREGNALRLKMRPYRADEVKRAVDAAVRTYTPEFFAVRAGAGEPSPDPVFILGMPRSGSTLLEQILSSHSGIEGTEELFAVPQIVAELFREHQVDPIDDAVSKLPLPAFQKMGHRYLEITRPFRKTDRFRFTDKNPDNWRQAGLIHAMLPNAKIIDIRRHPLDCCFANYTQHFLSGADYSYGFQELASRYREYVRLMRHFDEAAPGAVHRVIYEDLVNNLDFEVKRLFDYLRLPFEDDCLRFFATERAVYTPSAGQVRQPINHAGVGKWMRYEPWLGELKVALHDVMGNWRV